MLLPDGTVLMHADLPYDPAKAHAYYLKTRELHPRFGKAAVKPPTGKIKKATTFSVKTHSGFEVKLTQQQLVAQQKYAATRVAAITKKLTLLNDALRKKLVAAKKAEQAPTAADKNKAAKESAKYRDAHKQQLANKAKNAASKAPAKPAAKPTDTVASLTKAIVDTKASLKAAVDRQRMLASAKKNG